MQFPGKAGDKLTFKAVQTYSNGEVVRWIGPEGSDAPAPVVSVEAADSGTSTAPPAATPAPAKQTSSTSSDSGSDTLSIVALIVGIAGLAAGGAALASTRQRTRARV